MISKSTNRLRLALALLAGPAALGTAGAVEAQAPAYQEDPSASLNRHLKSLSDNPRSFLALMGAAQAALKLGDPQAAVTFFARAEEVAPRDPRIKAGMGAAFVQMEQPQSALQFFSQAMSLGLVEGEIAGDRGLAYDLMGDPKRAQADYRLSLSRGNDPEVERRLALSLAISGDREGALAAIDGQLRRQDRAAWRTRAFVLALTGDAAGATRVAQSMMPGQAAAMQPFFAQLPALDPAGRAMAVHFGHFPAGRPLQTAQSTQYASLAPPPAAVQAGRPDAGQTALGAAARTPPAVRRPDAAPANGRIQASSANTRPAQPPVRTAAKPRERREYGVPLGAQLRDRTPSRKADDKEPARAPERQLALAAPVQRQAEPAPQPTVTPPPQPAPQPVSNAPPPQPAPATSFAQAPLPQPAPPPSSSRESFGPPVPSDVPLSSAASAPPPAAAPTTSAIQTVALPESRIQPPAPEPQPEAAPAAEEPQPAPAATPEPRRPLAFAEVVEAIKALPTDTQSAKSAQTSAKAPAPAPKAAEPDPTPAQGDTSSRHWVQIASAPDSLVTSEYRRLKRKHASLLADKEGYRTPMGKSNRVLVGPFASAGEAREFVGTLKKDSLTAIAWTSPDGQAIDKIAGK